MSSTPTDSRFDARNACVAAALLWLALPQQQAEAGTFHLGLGVGSAQIADAPLDGIAAERGENTGLSLSLGLDFSNSFALQGRLHDFGTRQLADGRDVGYRAIDVAVVGRYHASRSVFLLGRTGVGSLFSYGDFDASLPDQTHLTAGLGIGTELSTHWRVHLGYDVHGSDIRVLGINVLWQPGAAEDNGPSLLVIEGPIIEQSASRPEPDPLGSQTRSQPGVQQADRRRTYNIDAEPDPNYRPVDCELLNSVKSGCLLYPDLARMVRFAPGSDRVEATAEEALRRIAYALVRNPQQRVQVLVQPDDLAGGSDSLSRRRTLAVLDSLAEFGVAHGQLLVRGEAPRSWSVQEHAGNQVLLLQP